MADPRYNNTIASCAMSLGLDPHFLNEAVEGLRVASNKYVEVKRDCQHIQIDVIVYGKFLTNETAKQLFAVHQDIKTDDQPKV